MTSPTLPCVDCTLDDMLDELTHCDLCGADVCPRCWPAHRADCLYDNGQTESAKAVSYEAAVLDYYDGGPKPRSG